MRTYLVLILTLLICACGEDGLPEAQQACFDYADAYADLCERCDPGTHNACYYGITNAAGGNCSAISEIRDVDSLYGECLPWLETLSCADFSDDMVMDESCDAQLLI